MRLITLPRTVLIVIALALTLLPAGVVQAAPPRNDVETKYSFQVQMPNNPLCTGRKAAIAVQLQAEETYVESNPDPGTNPVHTLQRTVGPLIMRAYTDDASIATVSPPGRTVAGMYGDDPIPNTAHFSITAGKKAGSTVLHVVAEVQDMPRMLGKQPTQDMGTTVPIKVVNCNYKVTMSQRGNVNDVIVVTMSGLMTTTISGEAGDMSGSGSFRFALTASVPPVCGGSGSVTPIDTKVTGRVSDTDQLDLAIAYDPSATISESLRCPIGGTFAGSSGHATSDVLSVQVASLPGDGGTKGFPYSCYGGIGSCTLTVTADPIPG